MKQYLLLLFISFALVFSACNKQDIEKDAEVFADLKCKLDSIDGHSKAGELNYIETEDAKEPVFEEMDILRRRYRHQVEEFDSLIGLKVADTDCK